MILYDMNQWTKDGSFKAAPGQEITEEIYNEMFNCMPPRYLSSNEAAKAFNAHGISICAGFLMGEPHSIDKDGLLFLAFGMNHSKEGKRYYYLGLSRPA